MMMKLFSNILPIAILAVMAGCSSTRKVQHQSSSVQSSQDSVVMLITETLRIDTVRVPGETVRLVTQLPCPGADSTVQQAQGGRVTLRTWMDAKGRLHAECKADSLELLLQAKDREISRLQTTRQESKQATVSTTEVTRYRVPLWAWSTILMLGLLSALLIYLKIKE